MSVPDFSALHCPPLTGTPPPLQKSPLTSWRLEPSPPCTPQSNHPFFNPCTGVYTTPQDGLYSVIIQLIPIGSPQLASHPRLRRSVDYVVKFQEPPDPNTPPDDVVDAEYRDVGTLNFAELIHFKKGTAISCLRMPSGRGIECIRFRVELIQRKRKRPQTPKLSKKQLRKRKMMKHKQTDQPPAASSAANSRLVSPRYYNSSGAETSKTCEPSEDSSDSDWSNGFESDTSQDELPDSRAVAKRLKSTPAPHLE